MTIISKIRKNCMGTISFNATFSGMRKEQDFIVYPNPENHLLIQSSSRVAKVNFDGKLAIVVAGSVAEFSFRTQKFDTIENIAELLKAVRGTASSHAGTNGIVYCDNSAAALI